MGDPNHGPPKGPHWDYRKRGFKGKGALRPDGTITNWNVDDSTPLPITGEQLLIGGTVVVVIAAVLIFPEVTLPTVGYVGLRYATQ